MKDMFFYRDGSVLDTHDPKDKTRVLHREDGPAVIRSNGTTEWYLNGKRHTAQQTFVIGCYSGETLLGHIFTKQIKGQRLSVSIDENQTAHITGPNIDLHIKLNGEIHRGVDEHKDFEKLRAESHLKIRASV